MAKESLFIDCEYDVEKYRIARLNAEDQDENSLQPCEAIFDSKNWQVITCPETILQYRVFKNTAVVWEGTYAVIYYRHRGAVELMGKWEPALNITEPTLKKLFRERKFEEKQQKKRKNHLKWTEFLCEMERTWCK
jgi:hypothetical protein